LGYICHTKSEVDYTKKSEVVLKRLTKNTLMFVVMFILVNSTFAKNFKISGNVLDITGENISNAIVILFNDSNEEIANEKTNKKGSFQFKKIKAGKYLLRANKDTETANLNIDIEASDLEGIELTIGPETTSQSNDNQGQKSDSQQPNTESVDRVPQDQYVLTEISFELKKMGAEIDNLSSQLRDLQARSEMWVNPLSIYQKEIILNNGSTVFGKIVYQDEETLKVETLVGFLVIDRSNVVRIVENVMAQEDQEYVPEQIRESYSPPPMPKLAEPRYVSDSSSNRVSSRERAANIVLVGNIAEKKDKSNNVTFTGQVKNVGGQRADFVKVNFVLRKNWSGETRTLTSFVGGSYYTFDSGITTDSSLLPGASGEFELIVPSDIGSFLGYSYTIDWEEYE